MTGSSPTLARFYVVFMTTKYGSMAEVRERAPELMATHLARSRELHAEGVLVLAGAFLDRPEEPVRTMGVFTSRAAAEDYAQQDPFVRAGMVDGWEIREWANMLV